MKRKEFHSPTLRRTVKPNEPEYLKHYKDALLFELNFMNKQNCSCMGCHDKRRRIEKEPEEIFNLKVDENFQRKKHPTHPQKWGRGCWCEGRIHYRTIF